MLGCSLVVSRGHLEGPTHKPRVLDQQGRKVRGQIVSQQAVEYLGCDIGAFGQPVSCDKKGDVEWFFSCLTTEESNVLVLLILCQLGEGEALQQWCELLDKLIIFRRASVDLAADDQLYRLFRLGIEENLRTRQLQSIGGVRTYYQVGTALLSTAELFFVVVYCITPLLVRGNFPEKLFAAQILIECLHQTIGKGFAVCIDDKPLHYKGFGGIRPGPCV